MDAVRAFAPEGAEIVVDCVGNQLDAALDVVRTGGRISLFGMNTHARPAVRQNTITRNELTGVWQLCRGRHIPARDLDPGARRDQAVRADVGRRSARAS